MFTDESRATFTALAEVILPATDAMPAASDAGVGGTGLDLLAGAAPRLAGRLAEVLDQVSMPADPVEILADLQQRDPEAYDVIRVAAGATYYLDPVVRERLGYPGQAPTATIPGHDDGYMVEGLLDHVAERGPRYRTV